MTQINPYIHFNGNAEEAFLFYQSIFGGAFSKIIRFKDISIDASVPINEDEANKIMQIALPIGENNVLMGSDVPSFMGQVNEQENRSKISIRTENKTEAIQLFNGLSEGGSIEVPMSDGPWGSYFGMCRDKYGIEWMVEYTPIDY